MDSDATKARDFKNGRIGRIASSQLASKVLLESKKQFNVIAPPYDPKLAASIYGISVDTTEYLSTSSGRLVATQGKIKILLNKKETAYRRRFSCAHELGHAILRGYTEKDASNINIQDRSRVEEEYRANIFAESFLMPENDVVDVFSSFSNNLEADVVINKLSSVFEVHDYAMVYRLSKIELPVKPWIFLILKYGLPKSSKASDIEKLKLRVFRSATSERIYVFHNRGADSIGLSIGDYTKEQIRNFGSKKCIENIRIRAIVQEDDPEWNNAEAECQVTYRGASSPATGPVILGYFTIKKIKVVS